jgi:hypothetical protein
MNSATSQESFHSTNQEGHGVLSKSCVAKVQHERSAIITTRVIQSGQSNGSRLPVKLMGLFPTTKLPLVAG